jgi:hypothetical protein
MRPIEGVRVAVALAVSLAASGRAGAQSAEAEALFNEGNKLMAADKLTQACEAFEASNRAEPRAGTLLRLADCREHRQQLASAWSAYKDALNRAKDQRKRDFAVAQIAALEPRLSYLTVSVSAELRIDGLALTRNGKPFDQALWNHALPVDGGDYVIAGRAPGRESWQFTAHVPVEGGKITVELPRLGPLAAPVVSPTLPRAGGGAEPPVAGPPERGTFTARRKVALGFAGASVVSAVVGVGFGVSAKHKQTDADDLCSERTQCAQPDQANALIRSARSRALVANVGFGIAAAAAIGSGVLWFTGAPATEAAARINVVPSVASGAASVVVMGRF